MKQPKVTVKGYTELQRKILSLLRKSEERLADKRVKMPVILFSALTGQGKAAITFETVCGLPQAREHLKEYLALGPELRAVRLQLIWDSAELKRWIGRAERTLVESLGK